MINVAKVLIRAVKDNMSTFQQLFEIEHLDSLKTKEQRKETKWVTKLRNQNVFVVKKREKELKAVIKKEEKQRQIRAGTSRKPARDAAREKKTAPEEAISYRER